MSAVVFSISIQPTFIESTLYNNSNNNEKLLRKLRTVEDANVRLVRKLWEMRGGSDGGGGWRDFNLGVSRALDFSSYEIVKKFSPVPCVPNSLSSELEPRRVIRTFS